MGMSATMQTLFPLWNTQLMMLFLSFGSHKDKRFVYDATRMRLFSIVREFQDSSIVQNVFRFGCASCHMGLWVQIQSSSSSKMPFSICSFFFFLAPPRPNVFSSLGFEIPPRFRRFPTSLHSFGTVEMTPRWSKGGQGQA